MIDYPLAKRLKESGFAQDGDGAYIEGNVESDAGGIVTTNSVYAPTLSELIEACGAGFVLSNFGADDVNMVLMTDDFVSYIQSEQVKERGERIDRGRWWVATKHQAQDSNNPEHLTTQGVMKLTVRKSGFTPEEAVANCWLALNAR
jgi:hypothetical protein